MSIKSVAFFLFLISLCAPNIITPAENTMNLKNQTPSKNYFIVKDEKVALSQPGPHNGGGETTGFNFFKDIPNLAFEFKKRILHPGSAIGYHMQKDDEIYYILSGRAELTMNGETSVVDGGTAILTRNGASHGLRQMGDEDLIIIIVYPRHE
jgi:mannose-6-phosphate isomerase-like protein (cupin superfamily)